MKGLQLTPLNMFILLVLVLIISVLLGYSVRSSDDYSSNLQNSILDIQEPYTSGSGVKPKYETFSPYGPSSLVVIKSSEDSQGTILFDAEYGNLVNVMGTDSDAIAKDATKIPYIVIQRSGAAKQYSPGESAKDQLNKMQTIGMSVDSNTGESSNFSFSYNMFGKTIVSVTWGKKTIIYKFDAQNKKVDTVYHSYYDANGNPKTTIDESINNMPLPIDKSSMSALPGIAIQQKMVNDVMAYQIADNIYFNFEKGTYIKTPDGFNVSHNSQLASGSSLDYDNINSLSVIATKFMLGSEPAAVVIVITNVGGKSEPIYEINTTVRVMQSNRKTRKATGHNSGCENDYYPDDQYANPYILKTQIVPPVCPQCPDPPCNESSTSPSPSSSPGSCSVTVNSSGQLIDCNGNVINPSSATTPSVTPSSTSPSSFSPSPSSSFGDSAAGVIESTINTAGTSLDTGVKTAGTTVTKAIGSTEALAGKTVGTAGNIVDKGLDTGSKAIKDVTQGVEGTITGLGDDVKDIIGGVSKDATDLAGNVVDTTGNLASQTLNTGQQLLTGAGTGVYDLANKAMYIDPEGIPRNQMGQPVYETQPVYPIYPGAPVYPMNLQQGYGTCLQPGPPIYQQQYAPMARLNDFSSFS